MLRIGFSTKYYTLWNVDSDVKYDGQGRPTQHTNYMYIQNLSMVEESAIEKAKDMGVQDLITDPELYGRNKNWSTIKKLFSDLPRKISPFFEYGKYNGKLISEVDDIKYVEWYYGDCQNVHCQKILISEGLLYEIGNEIVSSELYERTKFLKELSKQKSMVVVFDKNLRHHGLDMGLGFAEVDGVEISFVFPEVARYEYRGFEYYLPLINGKAKRIKNKKMEIVAELISHDFGSYFEVKEFELI